MGRHTVSVNGEMVNELDKFQYFFFYGEENRDGASQCPYLARSLIEKGEKKLKRLKRQKDKMRKKIKH